MCDPVTLLLGALSVGGSLIGALGNDPPKPPPIPKPATPAPDTRNPGATVRIGQKDDTNTDPNAPNVQAGDTPTRSSGKALSLVPLGRGGLTI